MWGARIASKAAKGFRRVAPTHGQGPAPVPEDRPRVGSRPQKAGSDLTVPCPRRARRRDSCRRDRTGEVAVLRSWIRSSSRALRNANREPRRQGGSRRHRRVHEPQLSSVLAALLRFRRQRSIWRTGTIAASISTRPTERPQIGAGAQAKALAEGLAAAEARKRARARRAIYESSDSEENRRLKDMPSESSSPSESRGTTTS